MKTDDRLKAEPGHVRLKPAAHTTHGWWHIQTRSGTRTTGRRNAACNYRRDSRRPESPVPETAPARAARPATRSASSPGRRHRRTGKPPTQACPPGPTGRRPCSEKAGADTYNLPRRTMPRYSWQAVEQELAGRAGWRRRGREWRGPCPVTGLGKDTCWARPADYIADGVLVGCHKCQPWGRESREEHLDALAPNARRDPPPKPPRPRPPRPKREPFRPSPRILPVWQAGRAVTGTLGETYLRLRRCCWSQGTGPTLHPVAGTRQPCLPRLAADPARPCRRGRAVRVPRRARPGDRRTPDGSDRTPRPTPPVGTRQQQAGVAGRQPLRRGTPALRSSLARRGSARVPRRGPDVGTRGHLVPPSPPERMERRRHRGLGRVHHGRPGRRPRAWVFPDGDAPSRRAAADLAALCREQGRGLRLETVPDGLDLLDLLLGSRPASRLPAVPTRPLTAGVARS